MGEKKRFVTFNLENEMDRELYELSKTLNFAQLIKKALLRELMKSKVQVGPSEITVNIDDGEVMT